MSDKCFCHLNGYKVKDSDARKQIEEMNNSFTSFNSTITNGLNELSGDIENLTEKDNEHETKLLDNEFNTNAMCLYYGNDLDVFVLDNYENAEGIDETKDDGEYVIVNNLDTVNHKINIPVGNIKMLRSKVVNAEFNASKFFVYVDEEGTGHIDVYFSTDGGTTFAPMQKDILQACESGNKLVVQLKLTGEITLKNICWGVKF